MAFSNNSTGRSPFPSQKESKIIGASNRNRGFVDMTLNPALISTIKNFLGFLVIDVARFTKMKSGKVVTKARPFTTPCLAKSRLPKFIIYQIIYKYLLYVLMSKAIFWN